MSLFALLTLNSLQDLPTHPFPSLLFATFFFAFALLFARQAWRERYPLRTEVHRPPREVGYPIEDRRK
jgi:hypothetical protein